MLEYKKVPVYVSEGGYEFLFNPELSLFAWREGKFELSSNAQIITLKDKSNIKLCLLYPHIQSQSRI